MTTALIIIAAVIVLALLVAVAIPALRRRRARRAELRDRLSMEAAGHRQELEANAVKAREAEQAAVAHRRQFEHHRDQAERFRRDAEEQERLAEEHAETASDLDGRVERAGAAARATLSAAARRAPLVSVVVSFVVIRGCPARSAAVGRLGGASVRTAADGVSQTLQPGVAGSNPAAPTPVTWPHGAWLTWSAAAAQRRLLVPPHRPKFLLTDVATDVIVTS